MRLYLAQGLLLTRVHINNAKALNKARVRLVSKWANVRACFCKRALHSLLSNLT